MNRPTPPLLELVICTYNNAPMLDLALTSLARQKPSTQAGWACLVVDNNCTDATADWSPSTCAPVAFPGCGSSTSLFKASLQPGFGAS